MTLKDVLRSVSNRKRLPKYYVTAGIQQHWVMAHDGEGKFQKYKNGNAEMIGLSKSEILVKKEQWEKSNSMQYYRYLWLK